MIGNTSTPTPKHTDADIIDLARKFREAERKYRTVVRAIDGQDENTAGYDAKDEMTTYKARLAAEQALFAAIDKAGQQ